MSNLADFFGVSVGYLIGETDYESFEMEKVCEFLGLEEETVKAIIGITSGENMGIGANSMCSEYKSAFRYILTASSFPVFIKEVREYAENVYRLKHPIKYMDIVSAKMRKDLFDFAVKCMDYQCISDDKYGRIDDFEENSVEPTEELLEAIRILNDAQDQDYAQKCHIEQMVKLSEYELQKIYFEVIKELTKEEHLLDMVIPMCVEKDLTNKD